MAKYTGGSFMDAIISFIQENKEWFFSGIGVTLLAVIARFLFKKENDTGKKEKPIIIKINNQNDNQNVNKNQKNGSLKKEGTARQEGASKPSGKHSELSSIKIQLYSTGPKGKIYTSVFYKLLNHNFGVELSLRNNTAKSQTVKARWCLYNKSGQLIFDRYYNKTVNANNKLASDFYVDDKFFSKLKPGKYKSEFWINGKKIQTDSFTIVNK